MYSVIGTDTYLREIGKWTKADKEAAEKIPKKLSEGIAHIEFESVEPNPNVLVY